jgi:hypothetical protein
MHRAQAVTFTGTQALDHWKSAKVRKKKLDGVYSLTGHRDSSLVNGLPLRRN